MAIAATSTIASDEYKRWLDSLDDTRIFCVRDPLELGHIGSNAEPPKTKINYNEMSKSKPKTDYDKKVNEKFEYKKVIFSPPCTIVIWKDGSKTMVRCYEDDIYDCEKGLALCFMKRALNITSNNQFHNILHKEIDNPKNYSKEERAKAFESIMNSIKEGN